MTFPAVAKFRQMRFQFGFRQRLSEQPVVAAMKRYGVVPDLRRHVNRPMQMLEPLALEELELEGLTQRRENSKLWS